MKEERIEIGNKLGLHARAAARLVHTASQFDADVTIGNGEEEVNAKSILGLLTLAASKGTEVKVRAVGSDEEEAVKAVVKLIKDRFGEPE